MSIKLHKVISSLSVTILAFGGFSALIYIVNLNQLATFALTSFIIWVVLCFFVAFFYDMHFKRVGNWQQVTVRPEVAEKLVHAAESAFYKRIKHLHSWHALKAWLNYLLLPGFIFWGTVALFYVNLGYLRFQIVIMLLSSSALMVDYWYLKEIFTRKTEKVDSDIFVRMSVIKIYASALVYGAALVLTRRFCLDWELFAAGVFSLTFLLIYQALYQHRATNITNMSWTVLISIIISVVGFLVLKFWGYNYLTAAAFMTICYNLLWGMFHYRLDKNLTWQAFLEILIISLLLAAMVLSVTNFKAQLLDGCKY